MALRDGAWIDVDKPGGQCDFVDRFLVFVAVANAEDRMGSTRGLETAVSDLRSTN